MPCTSFTGWWDKSCGWDCFIQCVHEQWNIVKWNSKADGKNLHYNKVSYTAHGHTSTNSVLGTVLLKHLLLAKSYTNKHTLK